MNKLFALLWVVLCTMPSLSFSQSLQQSWEKRFGGNGDDRFQQVIQSTNGLLVAVGSSRTQSKGGKDGLLVMSDYSTGNVIIEKRFGGSKDDEFFDLVQTPEGHFILAGYTSSKGRGKRDAWIVKIDEKGQMIWEKTFGTSDDEEWRAIESTGMNEYFLAGKNKSGIYLAKGKGGELIFEKTIGQQYASSINGMALNEFGQLVLIGNTKKSSRRPSGDIWVTQLDSQGEIGWERFFGEKGWEEANAIINTKDGGYAVAGLTKSKGAGDLDAWLIKISRDGFQQWDKTFGGRDADMANSLTQTFDGGYLVAGASKSERNGARHTKTFVVKADAGGYRQWEKYFGGDKADKATATICLNNGDVVVAGLTNSKTRGGEDAFMLMLSDPMIAQNALAGAREVVDIEFGNVSLKTNDGLLKPDDQTYLAVEVKNKSTIDLTNVNLAVNKSSASPNVAIWNTNMAGQLKAGEKKTIYVPVRASQQLETGNHALTFSVNSGSKSLATNTASINSKTPLPAKIQVADYRFVPSKTSDDITLHIKLENTGDFPTKAIRVKFDLPTGWIPSTNLNQAVGAVLPLSNRTAKLTFKKNGNADKASLVCVVEENGREKIRKTLQYNAAATTQPLADGQIMIWTDPAPHELGTNQIRRSEDQFEFKMTVVSSTPLDPTDFSLSVDGLEMEGSKFNEEDLSPPKKENRQYTYTYRNKIPLKRGKNKVQVLVAGKPSEALDVIFEPKRSNLHLLTIGPSHPDLKYTSKDAEDFASAFENQAGPGKLFANVFTRKLTLPDATSLTGIQQSMYDLVYQYNDQLITTNDVVLVFISSHGKISQNRFKILQSNYNSKYEHISVDFKNDIIETLNQIDCKKLVFLDACHSGAARAKSDYATLSKAVIDLATAQPGIATLTSCRSTELSYEDSQWQNGAFTEAMLEAFQNKKCTDSNGTFTADVNGDSVIRLGELYDFLQRRVPTMVKGSLPNAPTSQVPYMPENQLDRDLPVYYLN